MSSIVWPVSLPQELRIADHAATFPSGAIRTQMDAGPAKVRKRFTAAPVPHSGSLLVTGTQLQTLWDFFTDSLQMGAEEFEWVDPRTGDAAMVRFTEPPRTAPRAPRGSSNYWRVDLSIEVMPSAVSPSDPDVANTAADEEATWGPWYRNLEGAPADEIDPAFRGGVPEEARSDNSGDFAASGGSWVGGGLSTGGSFGFVIS